MAQCISVQGHSKDIAKQERISNLFGYATTTHVALYNRSLSRRLPVQSQARLNDKIEYMRCIKTDTVHKIRFKSVSVLAMLAAFCVHLVTHPESTDVVATLPLL